MNSRALHYCMLLLLLTLPVSVLAHRMTVFAWVEGNTIHGEASFSSNRNAVNVPVTVRDAATNIELFSLRTSKQGKFSFQITNSMRKNQPDLLLVVNTGEGHRGEWKLPAKEYLTVNTPSSANDRLIAITKHSKTEPYELHNPDKHIHQLVEQEIEKKLAPIRRQLAALKNPEPRLRDIMGGIGCILGIAGILAWLQSRNSNKKQ